MRTREPNHLKPFMSVNEVAIVLSMSKATVHRSIHRGDFPIRHFRINGTIRFLRREVEALLLGTEPGRAVDPNGGAVGSWPKVR